jgi:hypothetical protein
MNMSVETQYTSIKNTLFENLILLCNTELLIAAAGQWRQLKIQQTIIFDT